MISLYVEKDYSTLCRIWERSVEATHHFLKDEDFQFYKEKIPNYFSSATIYVYKDDNGIIKGFLGVSDTEIDMLFVDSQYFKEGVGRDLLLFAINDLQLTKVDVNQQNTNAFEFYKRFGFKEKSISKTDGLGKPYPICHLQLDDED